MALLATENLSKRYTRGDSEIWALRDINLSLAEGDFLTITGPSGGGKSTLLHILGGLELATSGTVSYQGRNISKFNESERCLYRKQHIGFIFQFFHLLPGLSVFDNVSLPLLLDGKKDVEALTEFALEKAKILHRKTHRPNELSGGEMQRVAIARALSNQPEILVADEPTGNLDSQTGGQILDLLQDISQEHKTTLIIATHSVELAALGSRSIEIRDGKSG